MLLFRMCAVAGLFAVVGCDSALRNENAKLRLENEQLRAAAAALGSPPVAPTAATDCRPKTFREWRAAAAERCFTSAYVCAELSPSALINADKDDPDGLFARVIRGDSGALLAAANFSKTTRDAYGCPELKTQGRGSGKK